MAKKYLTGGLVLRHAHAEVRPENILIENGVIIDLLPADTKVSDAEGIDISGMFVHPGLINAHAHGHSTLTKGLANRWSLELLLAAGSNIYGRRRTQDKYLSTLLGAAEMALKGCTAVYDMTLEIPVPTEEGIHAVAKAYSDIGMRAVVAPMVSDISFFKAIPGLMERLPADLQQQYAGQTISAPTIIEAIRRVLQSWPRNYPLIKPALAPTIPLHCSDELWRGCFELVNEYGLSIQCHLQESKVQALSGLTRYGKSLTAYLDDLGVLTENFIGSHGVWLDDDDMQRLGRVGASISHNPGSNMILGSGLADVRRMTDSGINVALGTDGSNCSDNLNMYESMRTALRLSHSLSPELSRWLSPHDVLTMATENGASALGIKDIGKIEKGYQADIVLLDLQHPNWLPVNNHAIQLVQGEDGTAVNSVMIAGEWVVREGKLVNVALQNLVNQVNDTMSYLNESGKKEAEIYNRLAPVISCFCPALMQTPYTVNRFGGDKK